MALAACHGAPMSPVGVSAARGVPARGATPAGAKVESPVPANYRETMTRVIERQPSRGHAERFDATVWVNDVARAAWESGEPMPDGAVLVEEATARDARGDEPLGLLFMRKEAGSWRFGAVGPAGEVADEARAVACRTCHDQAPLDDVFRPSATPRAPGKSR